MAEALHIPMTNDFDSDEEKFFQWWLDDLKKAGYITKVVYQSDAYITAPKQFYTYEKKLKTKTKIVEKVLAPERVYTPDFKIYWTEKARNVMFKEINESNFTPDDDKAPLWANRDADGVYSVIEVKGTFDSNNMTRIASINIDQVSKLYGVRINMAKVGNKKNAFFHQTFTPDRYKLTDKTLKPRKLSYPVISLKEFEAKRACN